MDDRHCFECDSTWDSNFEGDDCPDCGTVGEDWAVCECTECGEEQDANPGDLCYSCEGDLEEI